MVGIAMIEERFDAVSVGAPVDFRMLVPSDRARAEPLPLVLHLHGAMSSSASLERARPLYEDLWSRGELPRAVVACPTTPTLGGFYIDRPGAAWETLVARELPRHLGARRGPFSATAVLGASMGGYGALKLAFAAPDRFRGVAAISPAVFPGEAPGDVPARNLPSVLGDLHEAMGGGRGDAALYAGNSVHARLRANADAICAAGLPILIDCGAADEFHLDEGAEFLHGLLREVGVAHTYRLVSGAGHAGPSADARTSDAIRFIGAALRA